jgi:hypothetical protein
VTDGGSINISPDNLASYSPGFEFTFWFILDFSQHRLHSGPHLSINNGVPQICCVCTLMEETVTVKGSIFAQDVVSHLPYCEIAPPKSFWLEELFMNRIFMNSEVIVQIVGMWEVGPHVCMH